MTLKKLNIVLKEFIPDSKATMIEGAVNLTGTAKNYEDLIKAGVLATEVKSRGVVNDIIVPGLKSNPMYIPEIENKELDNSNYDVVIIGGGVVGCAIAHEICRYNLRTIVLEKENDVAMRASSRNDGMIHPGIDIKPHYKKASYNTRGNNMYTQLSKDLGFKFIRNGSYVLFDRKWLRLITPLFKLRAKQNKIKDVRYVSERQVRKEQPHAAKWQKGGMYLGSSGIVCPYDVTIALAEHAIENGVEFALNTYVKDMVCTENKISKVITNKGNINAKVVINAAGVYSDTIANMVNDRFFTIHPRKGTEIILDKKSSVITDSVLAKLPFKEVKAHTKGGGVVRTIEGNILIGPTAVETIEREDDSSSMQDIDNLIDKHKKTVPELNKGLVITYFSGTRASTYEEDFVIEKSQKIKNLVHAAGIQSPGLTSAPAIAEDITKFTIEILENVCNMKVENNSSYNPKRVAPKILEELNEEERDKLIHENKDYGTIVCRCEKISKGEILDALNRPLKVTTIDAVKRRCRAGSGRCQGGFCSPTVAALIAEVQNCDLKDVKKGRGGYCHENIKEGAN